MHVGLNLVYLVPGEMGGMEIYARELIPRLAAADDLQLTAFINREAADDPSGPWQEVPHVVVPVKARSRPAWVWGEQRLLPRLAARAGVGMVHSLASTAPVHGPFVRVTTIHDLHYKLVPDSHFGLRGLGMRVLVPAAARRSHRVIAVSRSTSVDLERYLGVAAEKIDVVPQGVTQMPPVEPTPEAELRERLGLGGRPVVLSVSAKRPHKNLVRVIEAVARIPAERRPALVIPGYPTPHEQELRERAVGLGLEVAMPGWLAPADLEGLYALADVACFPSLYEGFGLPVLEAFARGVPVVTSTRGSLAEVAGHAALTVEPDRVESIQAGIEALLSDRGRAARLREAGLERSRGFTWERTAKLTHASYRRALAPA